MLYLKLVSKKCFFFLKETFIWGEHGKEGLLTVQISLEGPEGLSV